MKVIQPFFLGGAGGLALALAIAIGLYLSPLRKALYLDMDPEISDLRMRMDRIQERLLADEMGIAEAAAANQSADSLKGAQAGSWKEYRHWRNRMGDISRAHDRATPAGFANWAYSLRIWFFPAAALLALLPGLFLAVRAARRPRGTRPSRSSAPAATAEAKAISSFQSAVQQVARIAAAENPAHAPEQPAPAPERSQAGRKAAAAASKPKNREPAGRLEAVEKETEYLPEVPKRIVIAPPAEPPPRAEVEEAADQNASPYQDASPYDVGPGNVFREPETTEIPMTDPEAASGRLAGLETQILNLGPGWGESHRPPVEEASGAARPGNQPGLSMQDEDGGESGDSEEPPPGAFPPGPFAESEQNGGAQNQFMPPTTEVERVERRKAEVLKLARKGLTSSEISRRMRISQDQVEFIIRMRREKG